MLRESKEWTEISRCLSHMLRHEPWLYEIEIDDEGWAPLEVVIAALKVQYPGWGKLNKESLIELVRSAEKRRHEIVDERIRALYGHSLPGRLAKIAAAPPQMLYHGTSPAVLASIELNGLQPMSRQYVHLSVDIATARQVGTRKAREPVILEVQSLEAHRAGTEFFSGNNVVWLATCVPRDFLSVLVEEDES